MDWGDSSSGTSSLTVGERICAAFIPFIALVEALIFAVGNCFDYKPRTTNKISPEYRDLARLADESPFTVNEVEALYELYKKLSNSIIKDGLIHKRLNKGYHRQLFGLLLTSRGTLGLKFLMLPRTLSRKCSILILSYGFQLTKYLVVLSLANQMLSVSTSTYWSTSCTGIF